MCRRDGVLLPRASANRQPNREDPRLQPVARIQLRSAVVTGIIGARRAWTVWMISALSMPCR
jgi:hypothetical protein